MDLWFNTDSMMKKKIKNCSFLAPSKLSFCVRKMKSGQPKIQTVCKEEKLVNDLCTSHLVLKGLINHYSVRFS